MAWIVLDFETASACDLKACGAWRYWEDPSTDILACSFRWSDGRTPPVMWYPGLPIPQAIADAIAGGVHFVAHNSTFEKAGWRQQMVPLYGWPDIPNGQFWDSMAVCAYRVIPLGLERALQVLKMAEQKDMEGNKLTLSFSKLETIRVGRKTVATGNYPERTEAKLARVREYCNHDTADQEALVKRLGWLPEAEGRIYQLNQRINERGIRLDLPLIKAMRTIVDKASAPLTEEFRQITGLDFTQNAACLKWVNGRGVRTDSLDKEHMADLLGGDIDEDPDEFGPPDMGRLALPQDVKRALEIKQLIGSSSIKKLHRMEQVVNFDGRARGLLQYHGTGPGRQTGRLFQPHNFPKGILKGNDGEAPSHEDLVKVLMTADPEWVAMVYGAPVHAVLSALRHVIIPEPDRMFVAGDYSGIQARLVLALAGQHDKTALMASGVDVYIDMAQQIYKRPIDKKKDPWERGIGKNSVLGLGFNMGWQTFQFRYCPEQPDEFAQGVVNTYRKEWAPMVPALWRELGEAALYCVHDRRKTEAYGVEFKLVDEWLTMHLPSGNTLWYFNPRPIRKAMPWLDRDGNEVIRDAWCYQTTKNGKWVTVDAHGGKTTENVIMGMERALMTKAMLTCERENMPVALEVHDEIVTEPLKGYADPKMLTQIMEDVDDWAKAIKVPVQVDVWADTRYKK